MGGLPLKEEAEVDDEMTANFYSTKTTVQIVHSKLNLMKVLFEILNVLEVTGCDDEHQVLLPHLVNQKLIMDSRVYLQIFVDLTKFISVQQETSESENEDFLDQIVQLIEVYFYKLDFRIDIMSTAFELIMNEIQINNIIISSLSDVMDEVLLKEQQNLLMLAQMVMFFINDKFMVIQHSIVSQQAMIQPMSAIAPTPMMGLAKANN